MACLGESVPEWVPTSARRYLAHTENGISIRALARDAGCHASTVLRQIRTCELRREDPLIDAALRRLGEGMHRVAKMTGSPQQEISDMSMIRSTSSLPDMLSDTRLRQESHRVLRRLCETGAILVVAPAMDKAVILRESGDDDPVRMGVVNKDVAEAMALKGWLRCGAAARIMRYAITRAGREALEHLLADVDVPEGEGFGEAQAGFEHDAPLRPRRHRLGDTPLLSLARRKDKEGNAFLSSDLVRAGERLREDFEASQIGPQICQNWDQFLIGGVAGSHESKPPGSGGTDARRRVSLALRELGPGLGDVVLRCCCYLEGLERIEKRMGWSARSGKIVLRIALQRLKLHYDGLGEQAGLIG